MHRFSILLLLWIVISLAQSAFAGESKPRMEDVAGKLSCYCGTCPHLVVTACGCPVADQIKADVQKKIDAGMSEKEILAAYVAQYGQTVLSAPPKSGFNLTAWALPFLAFAIGGVFLFSFLRRQRSQETSNPEEQPSSQTGMDEYRKRLAKELEERK